jgi:hypothetical protein
MRSAPCALAPSHSYHAMPPRITRNSHRPRASDRTMVNAESPVSLAALTNSTASPRHRGNLREWTTSQTSPGRQTYLQWAGSRDTISLSGRSGVFFLTSLFIELIDYAGRVLSVFTVRTSEASTRQGISRGWPPLCEQSSRQLFSVSKNLTCGKGSRRPHRVVGVKSR